MPDAQPVGRHNDTRSKMARISDARPFKPYVYRGEPEPIEVIQRRQHAQQVALQRQHEREQAAEVIPDPAPGYEWYRELTENQELAELEAERDRYQAAMAAVHAPDPLPAPPAPAAAAPAMRCRRCKYLTTSAGHRVMCDE